MIKIMSNMHLVTGYAGKTHVTAADHGALWAAVVGSGDYVLDLGQKFAATKLSDNQIRIADGEMLMQGRQGRIKTGETVDLTIENGTAETLRRDLIVARYTKSEETGVEDVNLIVLLGTAAETAPTDPEYITGDILNGASQRDFPLYRVNLNGATIESIDKLFTEIPGTLFDRIAEAEEKIDAVEATANTANANASVAVKIAFGTYKGTGTYGSSKPNSLTFPFVPKMLFVSNGNGFKFLTYGSEFKCWDRTNSFVYDTGYGYTNTIYTTNFVITTTDKTIKWYAVVESGTEDIKASLQFNSNVYTYYYCAIG